MDECKSLVYGEDAASTALQANPVTINAKLLPENLGRGVIENRHSTDFQSTPPPPYVCMSACLHGRGIIENRHSTVVDSMYRVHLSRTSVRAFTL